MVKQYQQQRKTQGMLALMDITMVMVTMVMVTMFMVNMFMVNMFMVTMVMVNMVMVTMVMGIIFACITEVLAMVTITTMVMMAMEVTVDMCKIVTFLKGNIL